MPTDHASRHPRLASARSWRVARGHLGMAKAADDMGHDWHISRPVYDREKKAAFEKAGLTKYGNVLRHSFCSYHVALHRDAARTALLMQHTNQAMLYRHYKGLALKTDAERYFDIRP